MMTLEYVEVPPGATRLRLSTSQSQAASSTSSTSSTSAKTKTTIEGLETPTPIYTPLPHPSPPPSSTNGKNALGLGLGFSLVGGGSSGSGGGTDGPTPSTPSSAMNTTMSLLPQLLLATALPSLDSSSSTKEDINTASIDDLSNVKLLSNKDPLSLPIMSTHFRRFVSIVGPVFWVQDRVEEVLFWKKGWARTGVWMVLWAMLCYYPRMVFVLPHLIGISVILSTAVYGKELNAASGEVPWQANIQGIQNLMGAVADAHDAIQPLVHHLVLTPPPPPSSSYPPSSSPYASHILLALLFSLPPTLLLVSLPLFPTRLVCLFLGWTPFIVFHPTAQRLAPLLMDGRVLAEVWEWAVGVWEGLMGVWERVMGVWERMTSSSLTFFIPFSSFFLSKRSRSIRCTKSPIPQSQSGEIKPATKSRPLKPQTILHRLIDNDRLSDAVWVAPHTQVELWENERFGGGVLVEGLPPVVLGTSTWTPAVKGWSKVNLRSGERGGWTRGRDGSGAVSVALRGGGAGGAGSGGGEEVGHVSNLTFSLAPGWSFVPTEDWRKDREALWNAPSSAPQALTTTTSTSSSQTQPQPQNQTQPPGYAQALSSTTSYGDADGWVYTNDAWFGPRNAPYPGGVTRRRRWVRRVWFDKRLEEEER